MLKITILSIFTYCGLSWTWAQEKYHYNQNYHVTNFIKEGPAKFTGFMSTYNGRVKYNWNYDLKVEKQNGDLDADGLENATLVFYGKKDTFALMPENPFYPMTFNCFKVEKTAKGYCFVNVKSRPYTYAAHYVIMNGGLIRQVDVNYEGYKNPGFFILGSDPSKYADIFISMETSKGEFDSYKKFEQELDIVCYNTNTGVKGNEYPGMGSFYAARKKYFETLIKDATEKKSQGLADLFADGDYFLFKEGDNFASTDRGGDYNELIKLKFEKDGSGKTSAIKIHESFTDGQFYDKEKFFKSYTLTNGILKSAAGETLMPLAGRLLVLNSQGYIISVITPFRYDHLAMNLTDAGTGWSSSGFVSIFDTSPSWWCKQELEEKYDKNKDKANITVLYNSYRTALGIK